MYAIKTENLIKKYKDIIAVDSLNLEVNKGELFALLGVNGAGKTTTVKMLSCLTKPDGGDALVGGHSITKEAMAVKRIIAVSPQETAVASNLTVKENLEFMCVICGASRDRVNEISELLGLNGVINKKAGKLSGGYQRRLSVALALITEPEILFLDEPTLGLDVLSRSELWSVVRQLKGKITVILTTHYMEEAEALSDRIGIMRDGVLLTVGTADEIKAQTGCSKFEDAFISVVKETGK